jgi:hypothetical protein
MLLEFLQSSDDVAADTGNWDRAALEPGSSPRRSIASLGPGKQHPCAGAKCYCAVRMTKASMFSS